MPHQHGQHQARLFAAAELAHGLRDHLAREVEAAQEVAQLLLACAFRVLLARGAGQPHHVLQRRAAGVQHVELLLREVADGQALAFGHAAGQQRQLVRDGLHEGGFALAVGAQDADALARQHAAAHAAQDHAVARLHPWRQLAARGGFCRHGGAGGEFVGVGVFSVKCGSSPCLAAAGSYGIRSVRGLGGAVAEHAVGHREHGVGQAGGFAELELEVGFQQHRRDLLHAFQRLHAALRLLGLGGLGLEAVDELLQVGDLVLLLGVGGLLQLDLLGSQLLEGAVVAAVAGQAALLDVQRDARHRVQEFPVVADDHQRAGVARQPAFQPDQGVEVQVVGGLVQQQQVARRHQRARQLQAHAPAAGEAVHRPLQLGHLEAQAEDQRLRARRGVVRAGVG